jgi:hypothetical protein
LTFEVPAGRAVRDVAFAYRLVEGRIAERWAIRDHLSMLRQLGGVPELAARLPIRTGGSRFTVERWDGGPSTSTSGSDVASWAESGRGVRSSTRNVPPTSCVSLGVDVGMD